METGAKCGATDVVSGFDHSFFMPFRRRNEQRCRRSIAAVANIGEKAVEGTPEDPGYSRGEVLLA